MAVFRVHKNKDYTVMSNNHLRDKELTLKAKGLMSLMLSLPDDWDYSINGLVTLGKDGRDSVMSTLSELEGRGYLQRTKVLNSKGQFGGYDYDIYEKPWSGKPYTENPNTDNPNTGKPNTENPTQLSTKQSSTKRRSTKQSSTKEFVPPTLEEVKAYCKERKNNVDPKKFFDYFDAADWVDSKGNPVRNWKQKVITWEGNQRPSEKPKASDQQDYGDPLDFYN